MFLRANMATIVRQIDGVRVGSLGSALLCVMRLHMGEGKESKEGSIHHSLDH